MNNHGLMLGAIGMSPESIANHHSQMTAVCECRICSEVRSRHESQSVKARLDKIERQLAEILTLLAKK